MLTPEVQGKMWADLLTSAGEERQAHRNTTRRADLYIQIGLEVREVCDALGISQATWYRRRAAWDLENRIHRVKSDGCDLHEVIGCSDCIAALESPMADV
jgi:hypothetical protein